MVSPHLPYSVSTLLSSSGGSSLKAPPKNKAEFQGKLFDSSLKASQE